MNRKKYIAMGRVAEQYVSTIRAVRLGQSLYATDIVAMGHVVMECASKKDPAVNRKRWSVMGHAAMGHAQITCVAVSDSSIAMDLVVKGNVSTIHVVLQMMYPYVEVYVVSGNVQKDIVANQDIHIYAEVDVVSILVPMIPVVLRIVRMCVENSVALGLVGMVYVAILWKYHVTERVALGHVRIILRAASPDLSTATEHVATEHARTIHVVSQDWYIATVHVAEANVSMASVVISLTKLSVTVYVVYGTARTELVVLQTYRTLAMVYVAHTNVQMARAANLEKYPAMERAVTALANLTCVALTNTHTATVHVVTVHVPMSSVVITTNHIVAENVAVYMHGYVYSISAVR